MYEGRYGIKVLYNNFLRKTAKCWFRFIRVREDNNKKYRIMENMCYFL